MMTATMILEWTHPVHGRIRELLCQPHLKDVMAAITILGIGCMAEKTRDRPDCTRCAAEAARTQPRDYVPTRRN